MGFSANPIDAALGRFIESNMGCRILVIFYPRADTLLFDAEFVVERLYEADIILVAPNETVCVIFRNCERILNQRFQEPPIILLRFIVLIAPAVLPFRAFISQGNIEGRVKINEIDFRATDQLLYYVRILRVAADKAMSAERIKFAQL